MPAHFGLETPTDLAHAFHVGRIPRRSVLELSPLVFAEADRDQVAAGIVDRLAKEVVALARAALTRLDLTDEPVEVVLGGGLLKSARRVACSTAIASGLAEVGPSIQVHPTGSAPVVGAALLGLDELGAAADAQARARAELAEAVERSQPLPPEITVTTPRRPTDG